MGGGYSVEQIPSLEGKTAIVTGANTGIGNYCNTDHTTFLLGHAPFSFLSFLSTPAFIPT